MTIIFYVLVFFLGATLWSFSWVIIERGTWWFSWWAWKRVFGGRSYCPWCNWQTLTWWQLIPVLWWLLQWGRCIRCKQEIPSWYIVIECLIGALFVWITWMIVWSDRVTQWVILIPQLIFWLLTSWLLIVLLIADYFYYELNVYAWIILLCVQLIYLYMLGSETLLSWIWWAVLLWWIFYSIYIIAKYYATKKTGEVTEWFGLWDVLLSLSIWLFTPFIIVQFEVRDLLVWLQVLFLYIIWSSVLGICYYYVRKLFWSTTEMVPFFPAMILMFRIVLFFASDLIKYFSLV